MKRLWKRFSLILATSLAMLTLAATAASAGQPPIPPFPL